MNAIYNTSPLRLTGYPFPDYKSFCEAYRQFHKTVTRDMHIDAILSNGLWDEIFHQPNAGKKTHEAIYAFMQDNNIKPS